MLCFFFIKLLKMDMEESRKTYNIALKVHFPQNCHLKQCALPKLNSSCLTSRHFSSTQRPINIFAIQELEKLQNLETKRSYQIVGERQVKEHMKKINKKKVGNRRKQVTQSQSISCMQSTINSGSYITKEMLLSKIPQHTKTILNKFQSSVPKIKKKHNNFEKIWGNSYGCDQITAINNRMKTQHQQKIDLKNQRKNIRASLWPLMLRKSQHKSLVGVLTQKSHNQAKIQRNGLKLKASSKLKKEVQWIQNQQNKNILVGIEKPSKENEQITKVFKSGIKDRESLLKKSSLTYRA